MAWEKFSITVPQACVVILTAIGIYAILLALTRFLGPRALSRLSTFDVTVLLVIGPIAGSVVLGKTTTLGAGIVALATILLLRWLTTALRRTRFGAFLVVDRSIVLMIESEPLPGAMARARITRADLFGALRSAGIRNTDEVACVILESTGTISVITHGKPLERRLFKGVRGAEALPATLFAADPAAQ